MKKLLILLIVLIFILLIALGFLFFYPDIADSVSPSSSPSSSQAVQTVNRNQESEIQSYRDKEDNQSHQLRIIEVSGGDTHTALLYSDGTVRTIGLNSAGQCNVSEWTNIVAVSAGVQNTVGLCADGTVVATEVLNDDYDYGQSRVENWADIVAIDTGGAVTVGLRSDGTVVMTDATALYARSKELAEKNGIVDLGRQDTRGWTDITAISAGATHIIGLHSDGTVVATGDNFRGQCNISEWSDIVAISAGGYHTVGLRSDGTVVATGYNNLGQCNTNEWSDIVAVDAGLFHTIGLRSDGTVVIAGDNESGGYYTGNWREIVQISAGTFHTVGLCANGSVIAAGTNDAGQCNVDALSNVAAKNTGTTYPNQYKGTEFESFLSKLEYPTEPFSLNRSYSAIQIENVLIVEIEKSRSENSCVNITFEVIGTVRGSDMISLDVDCFDADGYNIYSTMLVSQVSDGKRFKITEEVLTIPMETIMIEFN